MAIFNIIGGGTSGSQKLETGTFNLESATRYISIKSDIKSPKFLNLYKRISGSNKCCLYQWDSTNGFLSDSYKGFNIRSNRSINTETESDPVYSGGYINLSTAYTSYPFGEGDYYYVIVGN